MRLLVIGLDREVANPESRSAQRQREYFRGWEANIVIVEAGTFSAVWDAIRRTRRLLKEKPYDALTVQDPFVCGLIAVCAGALTRTRIVVQDHSGAFGRRPFGLKEWALAPFARWLVRQADRVRTVSKRGQEGLLRVGVASERIDVVSVPFERRTHVPSHPQPYHLVTIARASKEKGLDVLLHAFDEIQQKHADAVLTIVGNGPEWERLKMRARKLGFEEKVKFMGTQTTEEISSILATSSVYVQPSRFEGWGMAVCEAASQALPIVMTDVGLAGEVIQDGESGKIVQPNDDRGLAQAILTLLESREEASRLGKAAYEAVQKLPTQEATVDAVRASYERAVSGPAFPRDPAFRLFVVAFIVRALVLAAIVFFVGTGGLVLPDSKAYLGLAQSLLDGHGFTYQGLAFSYRTIGYPLFLAALLPWMKSFVLVALLQALVSSFLPLLTQAMGRALGFSSRVRRAAAWILTFEPHAVYYAVPLLTDWIFPVLTLLALLAALRAMKTRRITDAIIAGTWFGVGLLVKPLWMLVPALVLFGSAVGRIFKLWKPSWRVWAAWIATVGLIISPWVIRNHQTFGTWSLSSQGPSAAVFYLGSSIISVTDRVSYGKAEARVRQLFESETGLSSRDDGKDHSVALTAFAARLIRANPAAFVRVEVANTISFWTAANYAYIPHYYHLLPPVNNDLLPPTHYLVQGRYGEFFGSFWAIFSQPFYFLGAVGRGLWAVVGLLMVIGLMAALRRSPKQPAHWVVLAIFLALTSTVWVNGLGVEGRLRLPVMALQWLYAGFGLATLLPYRRRDPKKPLRLLVVTQRVDADDRNVAVHVRWLRAFVEQGTDLDVIAQSVGAYDLPPTVRVQSLGKERGASKLIQLFHFWVFAWKALGHCDAALVLMSPLYVLLLAPMALVRRRPINMWYTHKHVPWTLRAAVPFVQRVFSASKESFRLRTKKLRVLGHGIDSAFFSPDASVVRDPNLVVTVGRLSAAKRIEFMVEALERVRAQGKDVRFDVIGEPVMEQDQAYTAQLRQMVQERGLSWVRFVGGQPPEQVRDAYRRAAVCVNASKTGSLDKAGLEAMACGCPLVTTNEAFRDLEPEGYVVASEADAFAAAISRQLEHPVSADVLRARIVAQHDMKTNLAEMVRMIREEVVPEV